MWFISKCNQVLIAFFTTAAITFIVAWASYLLDASFTVPTSRILDDEFLSWFYTKVMRQQQRPTVSPRWRAILQRFLLAFSDTHLITGLTILIAAFSQLRTISIYHFNTAVYLGWLSSTVHMVVLSASRFYLRERPGVLYWRVTTMIVLWILLFSTLVLTASPSSPMTIPGYEQPSLYFDSPVMCSWKCAAITPLGADAIFALCLITAGFVARLVKLFRWPADLCEEWLVSKPGKLIRGVFKAVSTYQSKVRSRGLNVLSILLLWYVLVVYLTTRALYDIYNSMLGELTWLTLSLVWSASKVIVLHKISPLADSENLLNFGQILSLLLLLSPLASLPEMYYCKLGTFTREIRSWSQIAEITLEPEKDLHEPQTLLTDAHTELLPVSEMTEETLLQPVLTYPITGSFQKPKLIPHARLPPLLLSTRVAYRSKSFRCLLFFSFFAPVLTIILMTGSLGTGTLNTAYIFLGDKLTFAYITIPIIVGPSGAFQLLLAPFSRILRSNVRDIIDWNCQRYAAAVWFGNVAQYLYKEANSAMQDERVHISGRSWGIFSK